jgi:hypothetical protein
MPAIAMLRIICSFTPTPINPTFPACGGISTAGFHGESERFGWVKSPDNDVDAAQAAANAGHCVIASAKGVTEAGHTLNVERSVSYASRCGTRAGNARDRLGASPKIKRPALAHRGRSRGYTRSPA